jgi:hypothetical protein
MIDFDAMVRNEEMEDVILFLVSRNEEGISYPSMDRFFNLHKASEKYDAYNIKLINETKRLEEAGRISSGKSCKRGPSWSPPKFATDKKYGIE